MAFTWIQAPGLNVPINSILYEIQGITDDIASSVGVPCPGGGNILTRRFSLCSGYCTGHFKTGAETQDLRRPVCRFHFVKFRPFPYGRRAQYHEIRPRQGDIGICRAVRRSILSADEFPLECIPWRGRSLSNDGSTGPSIFRVCRTLRQIRARAIRLRCPFREPRRPDVQTSCQQPHRASALHWQVCG